MTDNKSRQYVRGSGGTILRVATITRPANVTAYVANEVVSGAAQAPLTFANVWDEYDPGLGAYITKVLVKTNLAAIVPRFRLWFFNKLAAANDIGGGIPPADNAAWALRYADSFQGNIELPALGAGSGACSFAFKGDARLHVAQPVDNPPVPAFGALGDLYCVVETLDAFVPASGQLIEVHLGIER